jgi:plasmid stabilization system protein ParE
MFLPILGGNMPTEIYEVKHTKSSENDLDGIFRYIFSDIGEPAFAVNILKMLEGAIDKLDEMPERYPLVDIPEFRDLGYRKMVVKKKYIVLYTIDNKSKTVFVERIINTRRDWVRLLLL